MKIKFKIKYYPHSISFRYVYGMKWLLFAVNEQNKKSYGYYEDDFSYGDTRLIPENIRFFSRMKY